MEQHAMRPERAPRLFDAALALDPKCALAWHELADLAREAGDEKTASSLFARAVSLR